MLGGQPDLGLTKKAINNKAVSRSHKRAVASHARPTASLCDIDEQLVRFGNFIETGSETLFCFVGKSRVSVRVKLLA